MDIARWAKFDETREWNLRVGFTLNDYGEHDLAIEYLQKSRSGGEGDGIALCLMAQCYSSLGENGKAIETSKLGISLLSGEQAYMKDWAYYHLIDFYRIISDIDGMLESGALLLHETDIVGEGNALPLYLAWYLANMLELKQYKQALLVS